MNGLAVMRELLAAAETSLRKCGFVLISCPREIQEMVQQSGVPALVWGGVHSTTRQMPFVSTDQAKTGELMSKHAISRGHSRLALLFPDLWNPGEEQMLTAIQKVLRDAGLGIDALVIRSLPPHAGMIDQALSDLFDKGDAPTALLCREFAVAERASLYLKENNRDVLVIYDGTIHSGSRRKGAPYVGTTHEPEYQAQLIGRMITRMMLGEAIDPYQVNLPVRLIEESGSPRQ
jgi:DNA-binding LacI/PurR family transcriptional regulator